MNPTAIYSKSGKGVQEASGKTSLLSRADRAVLSAFDGKITVKEAADRVGRTFDARFEQLIRQLEKDGFVREVSAGTPPPGMKPAPGRPASASGGGGADLDFTTIMPAMKPAAPPAPDLAASARAEAERKAKEEQAHSFKARQEAEARAQAAAAAKQRAEAEERAKRERERLQAEAAAKARADAEPKAKTDSKPLFEMPAPAKSAAPESQAAAFARAREEAEEKAARERERLKAEAEAKARAEAEAKARSEAEIRAKEETEARVKAEAEAKIKAAREAAVKAAAEAKAKAEAELAAKLEAERARAREEAERARREAEEKARREAEELRRKLEEERKAREEAERKAQEEARRREEEEERRRRAEEERRAREEAERKAREEAERRLEEERRAREEAERRAQEEARRREEEERRAEEQREAEKREQEEAERARKEKERPKRAPTGDKFADSLMDDLDSFTERDDEDARAKEEAARKENEAAAAARAEGERKAKEEARRKEEERRRREQEEEEARAREAEEREKREAEERERQEAEERERQEAEERRRKRKEKAKKGKDQAAKPAGDDDIGVTDDDLDMDDVRRDEKAMTPEAREAAKQREREAKEREQEAKERAKEREREAKRAKAAPAAPPAGGYAPIRRRRNWGRPVALTLFVLLAAGVGALHILPMPAGEYEKAAAEALGGRPVKISSARVQLFNGVQLRLDGVTVDGVKIAAVHAYPELASLLDERKVFGRVELEGVSLPQAALADVLAAQIRSPRFAVKRVSAKQLKLVGPLAFPTLEGDLVFGQEGKVTGAALRGPEGLFAKITPKGADVEFDVTANSFSLPIAPEVFLSAFAMKGTASREAMRIDSWGGGTLDGAISGNATVRWGGSWAIDGAVTIRGINAAVFAPALLSDGKAEGSGRFSLHGPDPMKFAESGRIEGSFSVPKGVLGSFDLSRAIQTGGRQAAGRTPFNALSAQGVFDRGAVALRNVTFSAGALSAGASADIAADGALSGRIVADVKTSSQTLRAIVNIGGTVREPQVKN